MSNQQTVNQVAAAARKVLGDSRVEAQHVISKAATEFAIHFEGPTGHALRMDFELGFGDYEQGYIEGAIASLYGKYRESLPE